MATEDVQISAPGDGAAPVSWTLPGSTEIIPKAVRAIFDGSASSGSFRPTLEIVSDAGIVVATCATDETVATGGAAEVTWFPKWKRVSGGGVCPGYVGGDVCGGLNNFGAFAIGTGGGATTSALVTRNLTCSSIIAVVGLALSADGMGGAIITGCTDSRGTRYFPGISAIESELPGPSKAIEMSMAFSAIGIGGLTGGNTITVTWDPTVTVTDAVVMAFALVNTSFAYSQSSNGIAYPGTLGATDTDLLWGPSVGLPVADFNGFVGTVLCGIGTYPAVGADFTQATLLDTASTANLTLSVGLIQSLTSGDPYEPGGPTGSAQQSVGNYSELQA